jgi:hypothetical protein
LTEPRDGRRPFHYHPSLPPTAPGPSSPAGSLPPSHQKRGPVHVRPVGVPVQPAQHPAFTHDSISSPIKRISPAVPQAAEGRFTVLGRRRRLARPPPLGDAEHPGLLQGRQRIFPSGGGIRFTTDPARPVCQHRRIASPSFLSDLQTTMTGRPPPPTLHNSSPAPSTLPEELLLARFVLVRRDGAQPPLSPIYDGPYRVLERSTHFFLLEIGDRTDKLSTLRLKAARTPADTEPAKLPRRGRPVAQAPPVRAPPPKQRGRPRQVTFSLPPTTPPTTSSSSSASGRPLRNALPPNRLNL